MIAMSYVVLLTESAGAMFTKACAASCAPQAALWCRSRRSGSHGEITACR